jgi:inorganic pyrophosphatase
MVERKEAPPRATGLSALPTRDDEGRWLAVIEATQGTRHKFKYHAPSDAFVLSGVLPLGLGFPYDFGFLPSTLGDDGDPLDVLVLADEALPLGALAPVRIVGVIEAEQQEKGRRAERNDRLLAVTDPSHRYRDCRALADIAANVLDEIRALFRRLQPGQGRALHAARPARPRRGRAPGEERPGRFGERCAAAD